MSTRDDLRFVRKPGPKYLAAVSALRALLAEEGGADLAERAFAQAMSPVLNREYANRRIPSRESLPCLHRLQGQTCMAPREWDGRPCCDSAIPPGSDHLSSWKKKDGATILVSQPYGIRYETLRELVAYCECHGLEADIDAYGSWHFPGHTLLVEVEKKNESRAPTVAKLA